MLDKGQSNLLSNFQAHRDLFPTLPTQSRFNRRRNLMFMINWIRRILLSWLDMAQDDHALARSEEAMLPIILASLVGK